MLLASNSVVYWPKGQYGAQAKGRLWTATKARSVPLAAPECLPKVFQFKREAKQREQRTAERHSASCHQQDQASFPQATLRIVHLRDTK
jgi:hypothetical protein